MYYYDHLEEVTEVGVTQEAPALTVRGVHADGLLALDQPLLHVADLLLAGGGRDLPQCHGEIPQGHFVLLVLQSSLHRDGNI